VLAGVELVVWIVMMDDADPPAGSETLVELNDTLGPFWTIGVTVPDRDMVVAKLFMLFRVIVEVAE